MQWRRILPTLLFLALFPMARAQKWSGDSIAYNPRGNLYLIYHRDSVGQWKLNHVLSGEEYFSERLNQLNHKRFYSLNTLSPTKEKTKPQLSFAFNGYLRLNLNNTTVTEGNPLLPIGLRRRNVIDFKQEANIHLRASYGERIKLDIGYNTETAIAQQRQRIRLSYEGEEHDFIQRLQAGNVRMNSLNPLIDSAQELFGFQGDFLLGPLSLQFIASRQHSEERRIFVRGGKRIRQVERKGSDYDFARHFFLSEFFAQRYDLSLQKLPYIESDLYIDRIEVWVSTSRQSTLLANIEPITGYMGPSIAKDNPPSNDQNSDSNPIHISSARRLNPSEYFFNPHLGFISLSVPLAEGEILAVAYSYTFQGQYYEVGDLNHSEGIRKTALLSTQNKSVSSPLWDLMMKNGYALSMQGREMTGDDLKINVLYRDVAEGIDKAIIDKGELRGRTWMDLFHLDQTNGSGAIGMPDGNFDLIEGVTYLSSSATLFIPYRYPLVSVPNIVNGSEAHYPVFSKLYSASKREAKQDVSLDRFVIRSQSSGIGTQMISLDSRELLPGSVKVERGGRTLTEGADYTINYSTGYLTLVSSGEEQTEIVIQERERIGRKEKSLIGAELNWNPLDSFNIGATWLFYQEEGRRVRIRSGEETLRNNILGIHSSYNTESMSLTRWFNNWSGLQLKEPSTLEVQASFAHLQSGYNLPSTQKQIVLEDFEQGNQWIDLTHPILWQLGSLPHPNLRAQLAWFTIDPLLTMDGAAHQPIHLRNDPEQRNSSFVRRVSVKELFPKRDQNPLLPQSLQILNISYYPEERGPYNVDPDKISSDGTLKDPSSMWGSMMGNLPIHDLESARFSHIELWILDPFSAGLNSEGELFIDIGRFKDEIIPDGGISYEGSLPKITTDWGRRSPQVPQLYGFDITGDVPMEQQDTGLNGLSSEEEKLHPLYAHYLNELGKITQFKPWENTPFGHPQEDPAGDDYHFFLGEEWDREKASILQRYKYINGVEGNSLGGIIQGVESAASWQPDTEDLNRDMIQSQNEAYLRYRIPISSIGLKTINPQVVAERVLSNGERWVKIRIALGKPYETIGNFPSLQDARSIRLSLTDFRKTTHLRFAQFRLLSTAWSVFEAPIDSEDRRTGQLEITTLSVEEDADRTPVPYVSPPGIDREMAPTPVSPTREDEQALALSINYLEQDQGVAIYKELFNDLRHYNRLGLFVHLNSPILLRSGDVELFVRLGHDYNENYYEYRMPLIPTPNGDYSSYPEHELKQIIWREDNRLLLDLDRLPSLKEERNKTGADPSTPFIRSYGEDSRNIVAIKGYPTLGNVSAVLIGVRNRSGNILSAEVWVNELSVMGARELGGDALQGSLKANLAELVSVEMHGRYQSAGFGGLSEDIRKRELTDLKNMGLKGRIEAGLLFPPSWRLNAPLSYMFNITKRNPFYDPQNSDLRYIPQEVNHAGRMERTYTFSIEDLHADPPHSQKSFYDINNLHYTYHLLDRSGYSPDLLSEITRHARSELSYTFEPDKGNFYRASSQWNRIFQYMKYASGADPNTLSTLQSRWDWNRSLHLRQQILPSLIFNFRSNTLALIEEPFEKEHQYDKSAQFRLLTRDILTEIFSLGETMHYANSIELSYNLPSFQKKGWQGLRGRASWMSRYSWDRGNHLLGKEIGNRAENSSVFDLLLYYDVTPLYAPKAQAIVKNIDLHFRQNTGSTLPGLLPYPGKVLGINTYNRELAPTLSYYFAIGNPQKELTRAFQRGWITSDQSHIRPLTFFHRSELDIGLLLSPIKELEINLRWMIFDHKHHELRPEGSYLRHQSGGSRRFSIIAKKWRENLDPDALPSSFFKACVLGGHFNNSGLPSLLSAMPNIDINYRLIHLNKWLSTHFADIRLNHRYAAYADLPNYYKKTEETTEIDIPTLTVSEEFNPLIGLTLATKNGIKVEERFVTRRGLTLLSSSARLLHQKDQEISTSIQYAFKFKPLFRSSFKLLQSFEQGLSVQVLHRYTKSLLLTHNLIDHTQSATQGVLNHSFQFSAEYTLSDAISLRGFYELQSRKPLVTNYNHPYHRTSYGVICNIRLQ